MTNKKIDIVLPCYNPPVGWEQSVISKFQAIEQKYIPYQFRLHIVNDGSVKGYDNRTIEALREAIPTINLVLYEQNRGKGYALRQAVGECTNDYILYTDYDFPYTESSFDNVVNALVREQADVVVAIRGKAYRKNLPLFRRVLSISSHLLNRMLFGLKITDTQGGLKGFSRKGREVFLSTTIDSFLFDTQFVKKASDQNDIRLLSVDAEIREGIHMSRMGIKVLKQELKNIPQILFE